MGYFAGSARQVGGRTYFESGVDAGIGFFFLVYEEVLYGCYILDWSSITITLEPEAIITPNFDAEPFTEETNLDTSLQQSKKF